MGTVGTSANINYLVWAESIKAQSVYDWILSEEYKGHLCIRGKHHHDSMYVCF